MAFVDPVTIHNPTTGTAPPATWGDQLRDNDVYLYERGPYICTSSTRPGAPSEGFRIYETDTNREWIYTGSAWRLLPTLNPPRCKATQPAGMNVATATTTVVPLQTEIYDSDVMHNTSTNPSRILLNQIGRWAVWYTGWWTTSNSAGERQMWVGINTAGAGSGTRYGWSGVSPYTGVTLTPSSSGYDEVDAAAVTDYVELFAYQTSGATLTLGNAGIAYDLHLTVRYIGPLF